MSFISNLEWYLIKDTFSVKEQFVLHMLSRREFEVRKKSTVYDSVMKEFKLPYTKVDVIINGLVKKGMIHVSKHKTSGIIIIGLTERQDTLPTFMLVHSINDRIHYSFVIEYTKEDCEPRFNHYLRTRLDHDLSDEQINEIFDNGMYIWESNGARNVINITNTKLVPYSI